jgi:energy-coupling factor transporter ATP-binding protein EcfA2
MYLKQLTISNYKSFFEPKVFEFEPGFNVLLGANSSGKSSVLEAISFHDLANTPHRSILNVIDVGTPLADAPASALSFITTIQELCKQVLLSQDLFVGIGDQKSPFYTEDMQILGERLKNERLVLDINADQNIGRFMRLSFENSPSMWRQQHGSGAPFPALHVRSADVSAVQVSTFSVGSPDIDQLSSRIIPKIYKFSSERAVQHVYGHHPDSELLPSSANLAYCINHLQSSNPDLADELNRLLHRVFPTIHWVGAPGNPSSQFELKVHTNPSHMKRSDLAIPINRVGTGVANALSMLYVALTAQTQRFILLEEPNSFLHPRALRELLAILAEIGSKHQFFVTTHSSDVLRTINASTVTLLEHDGYETKVKQSSGKALHNFQAGLVDLGIRLTDLHGCDKVLWVEGETEEAIFPLLLKHFFPELAQGIAVLPLHATGDFEAKKYEPRKVAEIYKKLSEGSFLAPPMVAIALDKERRSSSEIKQVEKDCAGIVHFLPRTMLEDYLLSAEAIAAVLSQELEVEVAQADIEKALKNAIASESCLLNPKSKSDKTIHAAKILKSVFESVATVEYRKTAHGPKIAEWMLANKPDKFQELKEWFGRFLSTQN